MSDEDIIKRKLLIDGEGTGDDRRFNVIAKSLKKWTSSSDDTPPSENQAIHDKILTQLGICEFSVRRSQLYARATAKQLEDYQRTHKQIDADITAVKETIKQSKENLIQAKIWKQNHMMYDLLAQSIGEQPPRKQTNERLEQLQTQLQELRDERGSLENKLDLRRKQFHVLVSSASKLQAMLDEDGGGLEETVNNHSEEPDVIDVELITEPMSE